MLVDKTILRVGPLPDHIKHVVTQESGLGTRPKHAGIQLVRIL